MNGCVPSPKLRALAWACNAKALRPFTPQLQQFCALLGRLHAFGDYVALKCGGQGHNGADQGEVVAVFQNAAHKGLVDLDRLGGQALEVRQR